MKKKRRRMTGGTEMEKEDEPRDVMAGWRNKRGDERWRGKGSAHTPESDAKGTTPRAERIYMTALIMVYVTAVRGRGWERFFFVFLKRKDRERRSLSSENSCNVWSYDWEEQKFFLFFPLHKCLHEVWGKIDSSIHHPSVQPSIHFCALDFRATRV